jgi:hypothetical protein
MLAGKSVLKTSSSLGGSDIIERVSHMVPVQGPGARADCLDLGEQERDPSI